MNSFQGAVLHRQVQLDISILSECASDMSLGDWNLKHLFQFSNSMPQEGILICSSVFVDNTFIHSLHQVLCLENCFDLLFFLLFLSLSPRASLCPSFYSPPPPPLLFISSWFSLSLFLPLPCSIFLVFSCPPSPFPLPCLFPFFYSFLIPPEYCS